MAHLVLGMYLTRTSSRMVLMPSFTRPHAVNSLVHNVYPSSMVVRSMSQQSNKVIKDKRRLKQKKTIRNERILDAYVRQSPYFAPHNTVAMPEDAPPQAEEYIRLLEEEEENDEIADEINIRKDRLVSSSPKEALDSLAIKEVDDDSDSTPTSQSDFEQQTDDTPLSGTIEGETEDQRFERHMQKLDELEDEYDDYDEAQRVWEEWKLKDQAR